MAREIGGRPDTTSADTLTAWFAGQVWKPETRRSYRSTARGFFTWAHKVGRVPVDLGDAVGAVHIPPSTPRPVPDQVWRDALAKAGPREAVMLRLAGEAGLRRAEVARVRTTDVFEGSSGYLLAVLGKGTRTRYVPINDGLADLVRAGAVGYSPELAAFGRSEFLFPSVEGGHLSPDWVGEMISELLPAGFSMHKLRARFATRAYRGTRNLLAVQHLLGHSSIATTQRYLSVDDDELRAAAMAAGL